MDFIRLSLNSSGQQTEALLLVAADASKPVFLYTHPPLELLSIVIFQLTSCKDIGQVGTCVCSSRFTCSRLCGLQTDFLEAHCWLEPGIVSNLLIALLSLAPRCVCLYFHLPTQSTPRFSNTDNTANPSDGCPLTLRTLNMRKTSESWKATLELELLLSSPLMRSREPLAGPARAYSR